MYFVHFIIYSMVLCWRYIFVQASNVTYEYIGCYKNISVDFETLPHHNDTSMSGKSCTQFCWERGDLISLIKVQHYNAAESYMYTCACSHLSPVVNVDDDFCNIPCSGNRSETCGGFNGTIHFSVYKVCDRDGNTMAENNQNNNTHETAGIIAGVLVATLVLIAIVVFIIYKRKLKRKRDLTVLKTLPVAEEASEAGKRTVKTGSDKKAKKVSKSSANTYTNTTESSPLHGEKEPEDTGDLYEPVMDAKKPDFDKKVYLTMDERKKGIEVYTPMSEQNVLAEGESRYENTTKLKGQLQKCDKESSPTKEFYENINPVLEYEVPVHHGQDNDETDEDGQVYEPMDVKT